MDMVVVIQSYFVLANRLVKPRLSDGISIVGKVTEQGATALPRFEVVMVLTSEFLYQYNLTSKKVKAFVPS